MIASAVSPLFAKGMGNVMENVPVVTICGKCGKKLITQSYLAPVTDQTPADKIIKTYDPNLPPYAVLCACGYYTMNTRGKNPAVP